MECIVPQQKDGHSLEIPVIVPKHINSITQSVFRLFQNKVNSLLSHCVIPIKLTTEGYDIPCSAMLESGAGGEFYGH